MSNRHEPLLRAAERRFRMEAWPASEDISHWMDAVDHDGIEVPATIRSLQNCSFKKLQLSDENDIKTLVYKVTFDRPRSLGWLNILRLWLQIANQLAFENESGACELSRFHLSDSKKHNKSKACQSLYILLQVRSEGCFYAGIAINHLPLRAFCYIRPIREPQTSGWVLSDAQKQDYSAKLLSAEGEALAYRHLWRLLFQSDHRPNEVGESQGVYASPYNIISTAKILSWRGWRYSLMAPVEHQIYRSAYVFGEDNRLSFAMNRSFTSQSKDTDVWSGPGGAYATENCITHHQVTGFPTECYRLGYNHASIERIWQQTLRQSLTAIKRHKPQRNIRYSQHSSGKLDLYLPDQTNKKHPLVILFPGRNTDVVGARCMAFAADTWLSRGWAAMTMDTTVPSSKDTDKASDVIEWLNSTDALPMIDREKIVGLGFCYGALTMFTGFAKVQKLNIAGLIGVAGCYDSAPTLRHWFDGYEPSRYYDRYPCPETSDATAADYGVIPTHLIAAENDTDVMLALGELMFTQQESRGVPMTMDSIPADHFEAFEQLGVADSPANQSIDKFLKNITY